MKQTPGLKPQIRSIQSYAADQASNFSPLPGSTHCDGVDQELKTYSFAQNNISSESGQSRNFSELLAESRSLSDVFANWNLFFDCTKTQTNKIYEFPSTLSSFCNCCGLFF